MTVALPFWLLMIFALILGFAWKFWPDTSGPVVWHVGGLYLFVLLCLLGLGVFGFPIRG